MLAESLANSVNAYISIMESPPVMATGAIGPLWGCGLAVKDNIDVDGFLTTCGSSFFRDRPNADAPLVREIRRLGACVIGKTNMGEFALDATGDNPHFGAVRNPLDPTRSVGGSSGGSAAAVASGSADFALGTDSGGSVRIPAAFCGVAAFRPGAKTWTTEGIVAPAKSIDSIGIIGRTAGDIEFLVRHLSSSTSRKHGSELARRLAYLCDDSMGPCGAVVWREYSRTIERMRDAGFVCEGVSLPEFSGREYACAVIAYCEIAPYHRDMLLERPDSYGSAIRPLLYLGLTLGARDYMLAQRVRDAFAADYDRLSAGFDAVLMPTVPMTAPPIDINSIPVDDDETALFAYIRFTCLANLIGVPSASIRIGAGDDGLFTGMQLMGHRGDDVGLLSLAAEVERALDL
jgi:aspartyl-tRNA(Asn)/glutamyl-tRNA(Gln) amidotransferase subunit A